MPKTKGLTAKETAFVDEYLVDRNATKAAVRAGYSVRSAHDIGCVVLARPDVKAALKAALAEQQKRTRLTADRVLLDIDRIAQKAEFKGEFQSALRGRELIGKHLKMFTESHELVGAGGGPIQVTHIVRTIVDPATPAM